MAKVTIWMFRYIKWQIEHVKKICTVTGVIYDIVRPYRLFHIKSPLTNIDKPMNIVKHYFALVNVLRSKSTIPSIVGQTLSNLVNNFHVTYHKGNRNWKFAIVKNARFSKS